MAALESRITIVFEAMIKNAKQLADAIVINVENSLKTLRGGTKGKSPEEKLIDVFSKGFNQILMKIGILAAIWYAFDIFLRPIMSLFKLLMVLLLIPLMPLLKQMLNSMKDVATKIKTAQEKAGGEGMPAFVAGVGAALTEPSIWALIGAMLAAGFLASLGGKSLAGLLTGLITMDLVFDLMKKDYEGNILAMVKDSFGVGLAAGITALLLGAGWMSIPIGILAFALTLGWDFTMQALKSNTILGFLLSAFAGSALLGLVGGAVAAFLTGSVAIGGIVALAIGTIVFTLLAMWKIFDMGKASKKEVEDYLKKTQESMQTTSMTLPIDLKQMSTDVGPVKDFKLTWDSLNVSLDTSSKSFFGVKKNIDETSKSMQGYTTPTVSYLNQINNSLTTQSTNLGIVNTQQALTYSSYSANTKSMEILQNNFNSQISGLPTSLSASLDAASIKWGTMKTEAIAAIDSIISELGKIPKEIVTTHRIVTVYETSGSSTSKKK